MAIQSGGDGLRRGRGSGRAVASPVAVPAVTGDGAGGLPRPFLRPCLLLLVAEGPSHGYELLDKVRHLGLRAAEPGGLYRYLRAMERDGLVRSWWEPSHAGPSRRTYALTTAGRLALADSVEALREVRRILVGLLDRYEAFAITSSSRS